MKKKNLFWTIFLSIVLIGLTSAIYVSIMSKRITLVQNSNNLSFRDSINSELSMIMLDLGEYSYLSSSSKLEIVNAILAASERFKLQPLLFHAIFQIESDYRFNVTHPDVIIGGKKTNAVGLGGILWVSWADSLIKYNIAENQTDLYKIYPNAMATGYVLRVLLNQEIKNKTNQSLLFRRVFERYYGAPSKDYLRKVESVTSKLWLSRISKSAIIIQIQ